jgi:hypothetical protein
MGKVTYIQWQPRFADAAANIERANEICEDYASRGYSLTLRQLYYRFVANGWIPNTDRSYKNLGTLINNARLAGLIDWNHVTDRTRYVRTNSHWHNPSGVIDSAAAGYGIDLWSDQDTRVEVWVEKDALVDVIGQACEPLDVPYFSCRGYVSQSEMWTAAQRLLGHTYRGKQVTLLHLGDHDPSGLDMTRDIEDRLRLFMRSRSQSLEVRRIALTMDQIRQYDPPPNPAKITDSRSTDYIQVWGDESWELDALDPQILNDLITTEIGQIVDQARLDARRAEQERDRELLNVASYRWDEIVDWLRDNGYHNDEEEG